MSWEIEYTDEFARWWDCLNDDEQVSVDASVRLLERFGPALPYPHSSSVRGVRQHHLRELRIRHHGRPLRVLYAFDSRRVALLLIGGDKTGRSRWYRQNVPRAERLFARHVAALQHGGSNDVEELP